MSNFKLDYPHVIFYFGDTLCAKQLNNSSWGEQWSRGSFCSYRNVLIPFLHLKKNLQDTQNSRQFRSEFTS